MRNSKHTPGPWFQEGTSVFTKQHAYYIAETRFNGNSFTKQGDEANANAALITAAPEMFEALENALRLIAVAENNNAFKDCALPLIGQRSIEQIESILKKAKGE